MNLTNRFASLFLALVSIATAAEPSPSPAAAQSGVIVTATNSVLHVRILRDARLKDFAEALRSHLKANVIVAPRVSHLSLDPVEARLDNLNTAALLIRVATDGKVTPNVMSEDTLLLEPTHTQAVAQDVTAFDLSDYLTARFDQRPGAAGEETKVKHLYVQEIIGAIQKVISQQAQIADRADGPSLDFSYHPDLSLLVVTGSKEEVAMARKILDALTAKFASAPKK